jgi:hypothetical protein
MVLENRKTGKFKSLVQREELLQGAALIQGSTKRGPAGSIATLQRQQDRERQQDRQRQKNRKRQYKQCGNDLKIDELGSRGPCTSKHGQYEDMQEAATEQGKTAPEKDNPGPLKSSFTGFLHFATDRTLSGWELLCRMGKHTSKEFLYGRKHSRISKCRKTGTKVRSKSGLKTGPSRCPKHRKHRYTGKYSNGRTPKKESKIEPKTTLKLCTNQLKNGNRLTTLCLTEAYYCLPGKCCAKYGNGEYRQQVYDLTGDADGECLGQ